MPILDLVFRDCRPIGAGKPSRNQDSSLFVRGGPLLRRSVASALFFMVTAFCLSGSACALGPGENNGPYVHEVWVSQNRLAAARAHWSALARAAPESLRSSVRIQRLPAAQKEAFLSSLVKKQEDGNLWAVVHPYIVAAQASGGNRAESRRTISYRSGTGGQWDGGNSNICGSLISSAEATVLCFQDPAKVHAAYLVLLSCEEKAELAFRGSSCVMQEPSQYGSMVLEQAEQGAFDLLVATDQEAGGQSRLSKFVVVQVEYFEAE